MGMMGRLKTALKNMAAEAFEKRPRFRSVGNAGLVLGRDVEGLHHVRFGGSNSVGARTVFTGHDIEIGYATTIGSCSYLHGPLTIGKYCQFAPSVAIYALDHSTRFMTTYVNANLLDGKMRSLAREEPVKIGHDALIGYGAVILRGVSIGNGAVIAAGAVVTKDVPDYHIVAGVPAKVVKSRFSENVAKELLKLAWWDKSAEEIKKLEPLFERDLTALDSIYE